MNRLSLVVFLTGVLSMAAIAQEHEHMAPLKVSLQFDEMKKLVGKWEGNAFGHTITTEFRLTGGGSAIMEVMAYGQPEEMVTMYHMDGDRFLATHYCAAHNQPRMAAVASSSANTVEFKYVDGTNIEPGTVRMEDVKLTMLDADHHKELWTSTEDGKAGGSIEFDYHRVK